MSHSMIRTVRELVDAFGGRSKFAEFLKIVPTAVSNMMTDDYIPRGYHLEIYLGCEKRGYHIDRGRVFGMVESNRTPRRRTPARV